MEYIRRTHTDNPLSRSGYGMFVDIDSVESIASYGNYIHIVDSSKLVHISQYYNKIMNKADELCELLQIDKLTEEDIHNMFAPEHIVNSAGAWDNEDVVQWFCENIDDVADGYITGNGAIVFNSEIINSK